MSYQITEEQKKILLQYSAQTLPDNPSRDGFSAEAIRKRMYKPTEKLVDLVNAVFDTVYTDVQSILSDIQNGDFFARSIASWSASYNYGANEITFYPSIGTYGAFVQSVVAGNTNNAPYINGTINSAFWKEVVNFNTVTDDFFAEIKAVQIAAEAAQSAAETAQGKAEDAQAAAEEAESGAQTQAQAAASSATAAEESADAAESAKAAAQTAQNAAESAEGNAQAYAGQASGSANSASQSASAAAASANRAQEIVNGIGSVYKPVGSIAFSALPATPAAAQQGYVYNITDAFTTDARFVDGAGKEYPAGTNVAVVLNGSAYMYDALSGNVDLSNYAQTNGTYPNMSVGTASEAGYADAAASADTAGYATTAKGDASGNDIEATYATKEALTEGLAGKQPTGNYALQNGTYAGMTVGNATNAQNATKATKDASGNVITATYATKTENNAKYTKPSTGIPKSDLESSVQTSLSKADSALQSIPIATPSVVGGVKPVTKTSEMTQEVGVDSNGALWTKEASEGTTVVANPTATGTQDLNSLQVGGTVYNIPQSSGGITQSTVIERPEELPTATADSPDFVQTPDGTLYRKKAVGGDSLLGPWKFKQYIQRVGSFGSANVSFTSNNKRFTNIEYGKFSTFNTGIKYDGVQVYWQNEGSWSPLSYQTIQITDISSLTNEAEFTSWLTANATKQGGGGGASVSYEYVAQQDAGGGGGGGTQLYWHTLTSADSYAENITGIKYVNSSSTPITGSVTHLDLLDILRNALLVKYNSNVVISTVAGEASVQIGYYIMDYNGDISLNWKEISQDGTNDIIDSVEPYQRAGQTD